jgi:glycosyltransferase involved in cell wall biosynthesis
VNGIDLEYFNPDLFSKEQKQATKTTLGIAPDDFVFIFVGRLVGDKGINELVTAFELFSNPSNSFPIENRIVSATLGSSSHLKRGKGRVVPLQNQIQSKSSTQTPVIPSAVEGSAPNTQHILPSQLLSFAESNRQPTTDNRQPKLLLVGPFESSLDPLQEETLRIINTNKNIIAVGFQKDIRPYLAISDCLVFPSYREGFPNVVMQAGAMNLPSIVTDINGCNEIIIEGENGTIIPVKDRDAVYKAMKKMMENKAFRTQVQGNARNRIISRYEQSVVWNAVLEEYRKLEYDV